MYVFIDVEYELELWHAAYVRNGVARAEQQNAIHWTIAAHTSLTTKAAGALFGTNAVAPSASEA